MTNRHGLLALQAQQPTTPCKVLQMRPQSAALRNLPHHAPQPPPHRNAKLASPHHSGIDTLLAERTPLGAPGSAPCAAEALITGVAPVLPPGALTVAIPSEQGVGFGVAGTMPA